MILRRCLDENCLEQVGNKGEAWLRAARPPLYFPLVLNNSHPNTVVGSLVGIAPVGVVTVTDSSNLLRSTIESNLVVTLDGTITVVTVGVIDRLNVPVSTPRLNLSS